MATVDGERRLWQVGDVECVMISCCSGAELQVRATGGAGHGTTADILLRELYPTKSDLYERARQLEADYQTAPSRP